MLLLKNFIFGRITEGKTRIYIHKVEWVLDSYVIQDECGISAKISLLKDWVGGFYIDQGWYGAGSRS